MSLLLLAYPDLNAHDLALVQEHRKEYDSLYFDVVGPHFSFVFATDDFSEDVFTEEVVKQAGDARKIKFICRCATVSKDGFEETFHCFLVPDKGHSQVILLHDKLYSGLFRKNHRLDIDYIPHIAIGSSTDKLQTKMMVDQWNARDITIDGVISKLSIIKYENNVVTLLKEIALK
jgi:hypothetical protein